MLLTRQALLGQTAFAPGLPLLWAALAAVPPIIAFASRFSVCLAGVFVGLLLGGAVIGLGKVPPEATPSDMMLGGAFMFGLFGLLLATLAILLRALWSVIQIARGRAAGGGVAALSTVCGSLLGGLGAGLYASYWWGLQLWKANPTGSPAHEWAPILLAVECPLAFVLVGIVGAVVGGLAGLLGAAAAGGLLAGLDAVKDSHAL